MRATKIYENISVGTRAAGSVGTGSVQLGGNSVISGGLS